MERLDCPLSGGYGGVEVHRALVFGDEHWSLTRATWSKMEYFASVFLNTLTPKFYVALTGTSSLISGLILIFEWCYFRKYGTSFIEQVSVSHLRPLLSGGEGGPSAAGLFSVSGDTESRPSLSECKVWRNPLNLFRGSEYSRYTWVTGKEPLTYYDMNLSAQDHQTFFSCDSRQQLRPEDAGNGARFKQQAEKQ